MNNSLKKLAKNSEPCIRFYHDNRPFEEFTKKPILNRRFGYRSRFHEKGLLPRLKDQTLPVKASLELPNQPNEWTQKKALFGQNDYIDILGNGSIKPHELLREMPWWLRGFKENSELHMLQRMQAAKEDTWKHNRPQKWREIQKRIDYLYKYKNYQAKPPKPEKY